MIPDELKNLLCDQCKDKPLNSQICDVCTQKEWDFFIKPTTTKGIDNWIQSLFKSGIKI